MDESVRSQHAGVDRVLSKREPFKDQMVEPRLDKLRTLVKQVGHGVVDVVPDGSEKDQAILALRQVLLWIDAGMELNQAPGMPRVTAARVDEATAVQMRDKGLKLPGEL